jgi:hypothetical protein
MNFSVKKVECYGRSSVKNCNYKRFNLAIKTPHESHEQKFATVYLGSFTVADTLVISKSSVMAAG